MSVHKILVLEQSESLALIEECIAIIFDIN